MEGGSLSGDDHLRKKKRYHRHTSRQIRELESFFRECPHPDEKQRMKLSRDLGLEPRQIKFWFQNRRTQMKVQHDRADNSMLQAENDKFRCENIALREALKNVICPSCDGPTAGKGVYFNEQNLRMENARLKEELDRVSSIASKYIGRPISRLSPIQPIAFSPLDLMIGGLRGHAIGPSLDLSLHSRNSSIATLPMQTVGIVDMEKSMMMETATNAMHELMRLAQSNEPLWMRSSTGNELLNLEVYDKIFPRPNHLKSPDIHIEASRGSCPVVMNGLTLVNMLLDPAIKQRVRIVPLESLRTWTIHDGAQQTNGLDTNSGSTRAFSRLEDDMLGKWMELFPTIVSQARTLEILASGMAGTHSGFLQLMYAEFQALSPLVSTREFYFLRYCQQVEEGLWAIADVSIDVSRDNQFVVPSQARRLPSGCLIYDMPNGYSKVIWVEHVQVEEKTPTNLLYKELINSGMAFGAQRWLTTLQRMCERYVCLMLTSSSARDTGGEIPSPEGRRNLMKLAQRMIISFCSSITASSSHRWMTLSGSDDVGVQVTVRNSMDPGQSDGIILSASTSIWLPVSPHNVFSFFRDERTRAQWDVLSNGSSVQEVAHIANGSHPGNCISVLRAFSSNPNNMLVLQECCTDESCSLVVYSPIELPAFDITMSGDDTSYIPLLPSGFTILPDGRPNSGASTSSNPQGNGSSSTGSLITVVIQILVSSLPSAKLNDESVSTVHKLVSTTTHQIKAAMNCTSA